MCPILTELCQEMIGVLKCMLCLFLSLGAMSYEVYDCLDIDWYYEIIVLS